MLVIISLLLSVWVPLIIYYVYVLSEGSEHTPGKAFNPVARGHYLMKFILGTVCGFKTTVITDFQPQNKLSSSNDGPFLFAVFPHGVMSFGHMLICNGFANFHQKVFSHHTLHLVARVLFRIPIIRELCLSVGCIDADRKNADQAFRHGNSVFVLPGGEREQILTRSGQETIFLRSRKGFVKLAIEHEASLVPIYIFGESKMFRTVNWKWFKTVQTFFISKFRIALVLFYGKYGFLPFEKHFQIVVGEPIPTKSFNGEASNESIDQVHRLFEESLVALYDKYKETCGNSGVPLKVY